MNEQIEKVKLTNGEEVSYHKYLKIFKKLQQSHLIPYCCLTDDEKKVLELHRTSVIYNNTNDLRSVYRWIPLPLKINYEPRQIYRIAKCEQPLSPVRVGPSHGKDYVDIAIEITPHVTDIPMRIFKTKGTYFRYTDAPSIIGFMGYVYPEFELPIATSHFHADKGRDVIVFPTHVRFAK